MKDDSTLAYLAEVLALDPSEQSGRIMELRAARSEGVAGARRKGRGSSRDRDEARTNARDAIEAIRAEFWSLDADDLVARLEALALDEFPDLARARTRLLLVNDARPELEDLQHGRGVDQTLTATLRSVLVATGSEAARLREESAQDCARPHRTRQARSFARHVREHCPGLTALEGDWLTRLVRARKDRKDSAAIKGGFGCLGVYILISIGARIIELIIEWFQGP